jgi:hypothetical protein
LLPLPPGVTVSIDPPKDGDCQFAAAAYLLNHLMQLTLTPETVRADVIRFLGGNDNAFLRDGTPFNFQEHLVTTQQKTIHSRDSYLHNMSRKGTFGDHVTLIAIACTYNVQFVVLSSLGEEATRLISPNMNSSYDDSLPTAFLGHFAEGQGTHYVGLLPDNPETLTNLIQRYTSTNSSVPVHIPTGSSISVAVPCYTSTNSSPEPDDAESGSGGPSLSDLGLKCVGPKQPQLASFPKTVFGKQNRAFSTTYYASYPWLEYSVERDAVFCFPCRHFHTDRLFVEELFINTGMRDWKKLSEKLSKHAGSQSHISHMKKWLAFKSIGKTGSVAMQVSGAHRAQVLKNRQYLAMVCDVVKLLAKLGLPFRGHDEGKYSMSKGNFLEVCDFLSGYVDSFKDMQQSYFNCSSPEFQNEIINICGDAVRSSIVDAVRKVGFCTIIVDEARSAKTEQLSLCVRYADGLHVKERFLTFVDCSDSRDAEGITKIILNCLQELHLKDILIVGQSYDGAAVMAGHVSGVQTRVKTAYPLAMYFHCLAHKLNLVLVKACSVNRMAVAFFNTIEQLYKFFVNPGSHKLFLDMNIRLGLKAREVGQLSDTRWACRWKSVEAVKLNYAAIVKTLEDLSDPTVACSAEAAGLSLHIQKVEFVVALTIFEDFLRLIHVAHKALQCPDISLGKAGGIIERLTVSFRNRRSHKQFRVLYYQAEEMCKSHGIVTPTVTIPANHCDPNVTSPGIVTSTIRGCRAVKTASTLRDFFVATTLGQRERLHNSTGFNNEHKEPCSPWYNNLYLPICDTLLGQLEFRFDRDSLTMAKSTDALLQCDKNGIKALVDKYADSLQINPQVLASEMELFASTEKKIDLDVIQDELTIEVYPQYYKMVQLALTLPVGSATAERSFSAMRRIRNWFRSTMGQERFSSLALLNIESDLTAALVPEDLVLMYSNSGKRRLKLN